MLQVWRAQDDITELANTHVMLIYTIIVFFMNRPFLTDPIASPYI